MYSFKSQVRFSETDHNGKLKFSSLMDYFQDASTFHSKSVELGIDREIENNRAWVVSYWQIEIDRYPMLYENIKTGTFPTSYKGAVGNRNFFMEDEEGNMIARAKSVWAYVDTANGHPVRITKEDVERYGSDNLFELEDIGRKVERGSNPILKETFKVRKEHIDRNEHVNNCRYIEMAMEYVPLDMEVHKARVSYKKSALYGYTIYPYVSEEDNRIVVELSDENKNPYCIIEFSI